MNLSFWEYQTWLANVDYTIIGSGIVGLNCALRLSEKYPEATILILEKGRLPQGASTKNAGFACFGSISEIIEDLNSHTEEEVLALVQQRVNGLRLLRDNLGDETLDYQEWGGYEIFSEEDSEIYNECVQKMDDINQLLHPIFEAPVYHLRENTFGFGKVNSKMIFNAFEGQIDTGAMMEGLMKLAISKGIKILNNTQVLEYTEKANTVIVQTEDFSFSTRQLLIATNGFASQLGLPGVVPARAQVLVTKPIKNLEIKGTFHLNKGYYYFRNINDRILFGGGRNLAFEVEETAEFGQTAIIQEKLEKMLREVILPSTPFEIDRRWSGIMGVGIQKKPILQSLSARVYCGVRLGGMGVAIGSSVGRELANLIQE